MISGVITKNPNFCMNSKPQDLSPIKNPYFLPFHNKKASLFSPKFANLRTKAVINDELVVLESEANKSFYELLGISTSGSFGEIKQAYKQLARKYHPDVSPPERTEEYTKRFIMVQEAYETLSDPNRRALYDRDMARGLHLAFSARKGYDEVLMERNEWKNQWQIQVADLRNKRMNKNSDNNMSWAAQMRRKRFETDGID